MRLLIFTIVIILLASCGGTIEESPYSTVYISFGTQETDSVSITEIPRAVSIIKIVVEAPDMPTIEEEFEIIDWSRDFKTFIMVPKGKGRHFIALAVDREGYIIFKGDTFADLFEDEVTLVIQMQRVEPTLMSAI